MIHAIHGDALLPLQKREAHTKFQDKGFHFAQDCRLQIFSA